MSGPKCEVILLNEEEQERIRQEQEARLNRERERIRQRREQERRRQERREEERLEKEKQRKKDAAVAYDREIERQVEAYEARKASGEDAARKVFEEAVVDYEAAAALAGIVPEKYDGAVGNLKKLTKEIQAECGRLRQQALEMACRQEVDGWIDRTVEEMGYHLIGQRSDGGEHAAAKLYRYDEETALHVIHADSQFTMEVVALDHVNRAPDPEEKERLLRKMDDFCEDYALIQSRLKRTQALEIKPVFHLPPDKKYASVVNQAGYQKVSAPRMIHDADYMSLQESAEKQVCRHIDNNERRG